MNKLFQETFVLFLARVGGREAKHEESLKKKKKIFLVRGTTSTERWLSFTLQWPTALGATCAKGGRGWGWYAPEFSNSHCNGQCE